MSASIEIELEKSGKAVHVEQSLRDQLKTFSGLKKRLFIYLLILINITYVSFIPYFRIGVTLFILLSYQ